MTHLPLSLDGVTALRVVLIGDGWISIQPAHFVVRPDGTLDPISPAEWGRRAGLERLLLDGAALPWLKDAPGVLGGPGAPPGASDGFLTEDQIRRLEAAGARRTASCPRRPGHTP
jgi:hypothetical protein